MKFIYRIRFVWALWRISWSVNKACRDFRASQKAWKILAATLAEKCAERLTPEERLSVYKNLPHVTKELGAAMRTTT